MGKPTIQLEQPVECINKITLIKAPKSCPYKNFFIEILYTNDETQVLTHKIDNPNHTSKPNFETYDDLFDYYKDLRSLLKKI